MDQDFFVKFLSFATNCENKSKSDNMTACEILKP